MSRLRWALALLAASAGVAVTMSLGNWQMRRAQEKLAIQARWDSLLQQAPLDVRPAALEDIANRVPLRVRLSGRFRHERSVWLESRTMGGRAGFYVVTPLLLEGTHTAVLVNRGFVARDPTESRRLPAIGRPTDAIAIEGIAIETIPHLLELGTATASDSWPLVWHNLDYTEYERASGMPVARFVLQQTSDGHDGLARRWAVPSAGVETHRGYAVQWYSLAALLFALTMLLVVRAWRRRAFEAEQAE